MTHTPMTNSIRSLAAIAVLAALTSTALLAGDGAAARQAPPATGPVPQRLAGTLILKLKRSVPNRRGAVHFNVAQLDAVLDHLGASQRRSLFPLAPYPEVLEQGPAGDPATVGFDRVYVVRYSAPFEPLEAASELLGTGLVEFAEPYYVFKLAYTPSDQYLQAEGWLNPIQARQAWDITKGDSTIAIGIVDTGVDWMHEDLGANIWINPGETGTDSQGHDKSTNGKDDDGNGFVDDYHGWDFVGNPSVEDFQSLQFTQDNNPAPHAVDVAGYEGYHGTAVSGCASGVADNHKGIAGIGFRTKLLPVKCAGDSVGTGSVATGYDGIRYAADMGVRVINCSWGGPVDAGNTQALQTVVNYVHSKGALLVSSSGNGGTNNDQAPTYPANLKHVLSVGATTSLDSAANFSQYGVSVGVWAPGVSVFTTLPGSSYSSTISGSPINGTSFSSPITSGIAALVFSMHPTWDPDQVAMQLHVTGDHVQVAEDLAPYFYRRVNAYRAVALNTTLADGDPTGLPGVAIDAYTINGHASDTITSLDQVVTVQLTMKNFLSPAHDLLIDAAPNQTLTVASPVTVGSIGTMQTTTQEVRVKVNENSSVIYSEGNMQLVLKLTSGPYEDYVAVQIPVRLPGWHQQMNPLATNQFTTFAGAGIVAVTPKIAWAISNVGNSQATQTAATAHTSNGTSWSQFQGGFPSGEPCYCIDARDALHAWAGSGPTSRLAGIFRTTNGGSSWNRTSVSDITPFVNSVHFFDSQNGIFLGDPLNSQWGIATTSDAGATWAPLETPLAPGGATEAGWNNSIAVFGDNVWFGTNNSRIYRSTDRGRTWRSGSTPSANSFGIAFATASDGLATFNTVSAGTGSEMIAATHNGGATWSAVTLPFAEARPQSVTFVPGTNRAFVGTQNGVFETSDFGATWKRMAMPPMVLEGILLSAQRDASGHMGAFGNSFYSQLMTYVDTVSGSNLGVPGVAADASAGSAATLYQNLPNPFAGTTSIPFELRATADVRLVLHDMLGLQVRTIASGHMAAGPHTATLSTDGLPAGNYFYTLQIGNELLSRRLTVVK